MMEADFAVIFDVAISDITMITAVTVKRPRPETAY
jgi:hypothetical protein